jgi:hypothetical protein
MGPARGQQSAQGLGISRRRGRERSLRATEGAHGGSRRAIGTHVATLATIHTKAIRMRWLRSAS